MNKTRSHLHMFERIFKSILFSLYLKMFIFTTNQYFWACDITSRIMSCDYFLDRKYILKFTLLFHDPI
jgi:hypothetical protein